jgi:hypothetical protein
LPAPDSGRGVRYARAIERRWSELLDAPVVLSPRDWSRIEDWRRRGVPLAVVEEAMAAVVRPRRPRRRPPRLADVVPLVEESWSAVVEGRREPPDRVVSTRHGPEPSERWRRRAAAEPGSALAELLAALIERWEAGEPSASIDAALDRRLPEAVEGAMVERVRRELSDELAAYRNRMDAEQLKRTGRRACVDRLRRLLDLPRLASRPRDP